MGLLLSTAVYGVFEITTRAKGRPTQSKERDGTQCFSIMKRLICGRFCSHAQTVSSNAFDRTVADRAPTSARMVQNNRSFGISAQLKQP